MRKAVLAKYRFDNLDRRPSRSGGFPFGTGIRQLETLVVLARRGRRVRSLSAACALEHDTNLTESAGGLEDDLAGS
jgi:hypothetical protein